MSQIRLLSVASEIYPLVKTGGLADVVGTLPGALAQEGVAVRTLVPGYPKVMSAIAQKETVRHWASLFGGPADLLAATAQKLDLLVLDAPHLYDRPGNPYVRPDGTDWPDNALRFAALCQAAADVARGDVAAFVPDIVHAHDWQAGLVPAYLHYGGGNRPGTIITVHNLAYQGLCPASLLATLGLPARAYAIDGVEYFGTISFLKAALQLADRITTVSPTYAVEIMGPDAGMGLDGVLRGRADVVSGIVNGIDVDVWNPADDRYIAAPFDVRRLTQRAKNKEALQARMDLAADPGAMLYGVVSRLSWQKGLDLLLDALPQLLANGGQLALIGSGDADLEQKFTLAAERNSGRVACVIGYDEELAHLVQAGSDVIAVPSRYEPCGLTQLCAQRYGAIPLVARVGGLADTVIDAGEMAVAAGAATGVQFAPVNLLMLQAAIRRSAGLFADKPTWARMQRNGMKTDVSWRNPARHYVTLYRDLLASRASR
jgi:starch synthase